MKKFTLNKHPTNLKSLVVDESPRADIPDLIHDLVRVVQSQGLGVDNLANFIHFSRIIIHYFKNKSIVFSRKVYDLFLYIIDTKLISSIVCNSIAVCVFS